jgi:hypothetical protein
MVDWVKQLTDTIQRRLRTMSTMISEVYDALKAAGVPDDKARAAAQAVAQYDRDIAELKAGQMLLKWMVGFNLAFTMAILWMACPFVIAWPEAGLRSFHGT